MGTPATLPEAPLSQERLWPGANSWILGPREERGGTLEEMEPELAQPSPPPSLLAEKLRLVTVWGHL